MKFNSNFDDAFSDVEHHQKKVKVNKLPELSKSEIAVEANNIINTLCDYKNIFGYIAKNSKNDIIYVKYNKNSEVFVAYNPESKAFIKTCVKTWREYNGNIYLDDEFPYFDELPRNS